MDDSIGIVKWPGIDSRRRTCSTISAESNELFDEMTVRGLVLQQ